MSETCETCRWWDKRTHCRRFPPQLALWPSGNQQPIIYDVFPSWPATLPTDWCGEHQPKEGGA